VERAATPYKQRVILSLKKISGWPSENSPRVTKKIEIKKGFK
jgi:hypothetical protein